MALRLGESLCLIILGIVRTALFLSIRFIFMQIQRVLWWSRGVQGVVHHNRQPRDGSAPVAQALKVVAAYKACYTRHPNLQDFILAHDEYVDLEYVVKHDHITLFFIDHEQDLAVFGEGQPDQLLWSSRSEAFLIISLTKHSRRLILMRLTDFHTLCQSLPDPKGNLVILGNTGRCGSTLVSQIFEHTDKVITYSEPPVFNTVATMHSKDGATEEVMQLTKHCIKMYCRPIRAIPDPVGYFIKPINPTFSLSPVIQELYPSTRLFFIYRDWDKVTRSLYKLSFKLPTVRLAYVLSKILILFQKTIGRIIKIKDLGRIPSNCHSFGVYVLLPVVKIYHEMLQNDKVVHGLLFDDIIKDKLTAVKAIFKLSGIPEDFAQNALRAFDQDSQAKCLASKENLSRIRPLEVSYKDIKETDCVLEEFGIPPLNQDSRLRGTVDFKQVLCNK